MYENTRKQKSKHKNENLKIGYTITQGKNKTSFKSNRMHCEISNSTNNLLSIAEALLMDKTTEIDTSCGNPVYCNIICI